MYDQISLALIQSKLHWHDPKANRAMFGQKIAELPDAIDLIVLPEMFTTGFTMSPKSIPEREGEKTVIWMQEQAKMKNAAVTGSIVFSEGDTFYNRLFFVYPDGAFQTYDKRHTFSLAGEDESYKAGNEKLVLQFRGFRICPLICYDLRFPVWSRNVEAYDLLIYVANWPSPRIEAWNTLLKARAIENMTYCVGLNRLGMDEKGHEYPGNSAVYDALGRQLVFSQKEENLLVTLSKVHIQTNRSRFKFLDNRDAFNLL